jgi:outer membrane protein OmpA-like peptidoglycan-associated protein
LRNTSRTQVVGSRKSDGEAKHREMTDEGERSNVGAIVSFELNSFDLNEKGRDLLLTLIPELEGKQHRIEVRGHAANNGGNVNQAAMDAWSIAFRRALSVSQFLIDNGIDPRRIRTSAAGNSEPRFKEDRVDPDLDSRVFVLSEIFEEPSSISERLISNKSLDAQAAEIESQQKAKESSGPKGGGH